MYKKVFAPIFIMALACMANSTEPTFSYKTHGNVANYFESEQEFRMFFDLQPGDVVAEIGANNGNNLRGFNSISHEIIFYLQDIDPNKCSQKAFSQAIKLGENASKNTFYRVIGTERQSNLPDNTFDKIFLVSTFHEFTYMDEMMTDIYKKLKPNGHLYILESHCYTKSHKNYSSEETIAIGEKHHLKLTKKDEREINNASTYRTIFKKI